MENVIEPGDPTDPIANFYENGHKVRLGYPNPDYLGRALPSYRLDLALAEAEGGDEEVEAFTEAVCSMVESGEDYDFALAMAVRYVFGIDDPKLVESLLAEDEAPTPKKYTAPKEPHSDSKYRGSSDRFGGGNFSEPPAPDKKPEAGKPVPPAAKSKVDDAGKRVKAKAKGVKRRPGMKMVFGLWRKITGGA